MKRMRIRRDLDGKVYQVHDTRPTVVLGVQVPTCSDVLVSGRQVWDDDVLDFESNRIWLDGYRVVVVDLSTPVDIP